MTPATRPRNNHVALLRAVNLAGKNQVRMPDLCAMLDKLGLGQPRSLLQIGNLLFDGDGRSPQDLETDLEAAARKQLGLDTDFFVRTDEQWRAIVAANPFPAEAKRDPPINGLSMLKRRLTPVSEPLRVFRRPFGLSHAAVATSSV